MKNTILKIGPILLIMLILTMAGCKKDDNRYFNSIIGKWRWLYTSGTIIPIYPKEGTVSIIEFTKDGRFIASQNDTIKNETKFTVSGDTLKYKLHGFDEFYQIKVHEDILSLIFIIYGPNEYYKRVK